MTAWVKSLAGSIVMSAALIAFSAPSVWAQTPASPATPAQSAFLGTAFSTVVNGREVWITTFNGSRLKARVASVGPAGLNVTGTNGQGQTVRFEDITLIRKVSHRLRTGTIVGLSVGAGLGLLGVAACDGESDCASALFFTYLGIGTGIGALSGAIRNNANRDDDTVYDRGVRTTTTVAFAPILSRTRKGAALSITWR